MSEYKWSTYGHGIAFKVDPKTAEILEKAQEANKRRLNAYYELMVRSLFDSKDESTVPLSADAQALKAELEERAKYCPECGRPWEDDV